MATAPVVCDVPPPWRRVQVWAVGGLFQVGYADGSDLLLVLSSQGRGVFDCLIGEKLTRDYQEAHDYFDPIRLTAGGLGPLAGQTVRMAGLFGGGLPLTTLDGWGLEVQARVWPTHSVFLSAPGTREPLCIGEDGACEMRACGFSQTGRSFVIATSGDLTIYSRPAETMVRRQSSMKRSMAEEMHDWLLRPLPIEEAEARHSHGGVPFGLQNAKWQKLRSMILEDPKAQLWCSVLRPRRGRHFPFAEWKGMRWSRMGRSSTSC